MAPPHRRQTLRLVTTEPFPVRASTALPSPTAIVQRCQRAYAFLQRTLGVTPTIELLILGHDDWQTIAAQQIFGMPFYSDDGTLTVAGEVTAFWASQAALVQHAPPPAARRCQRLFGQPDGTLNLQPFFDLLVVHELGHAFHSQAQCNFPRAWLSELFANLALHAYVAVEEPAAMDVLEAFPEAMVHLPATQFAYHTLEAFEWRNVDPANYGWYQAQFHTSARRIYDADGIAALQRLWAAFVLPDAQLQERLTTEVSAAAGQVLAQWPTDGGA